MNPEHMRDPELKVGQIWIRRSNGVRVVIRSLHAISPGHHDVHWETVTRPRRGGACWEHNWHARYQLSRESEQ